MASYLKDLKVHDVIQLALRVVGEGCIECRGGFLGGRCFGIYIYIYIGVCCSNVDVNLNSGLTTRAIQTHEILYSALRLREKKKKEKKDIRYKRFLAN